MLVHFDADPDSLRNVQEMRVRVWSDEPEPSYDQRREVHAATDFSFPTTVPIIPVDDASGRFRVEGALLDSNGLVLLRQEARAGFVGGSLREIRLRFEATCDRCAGGWTCFEGSCRQACFDPHPRGAAIERSAPVECGDDELCECTCAMDRCREGTCAPASGTTGADIGLDHVCSLTEDGTVRCSGANTSGQLGLGDMTARDVPFAVELRAPAAHVDVGREHGCAVLRDGSLWCWGANAQGQLGKPDSGMELSPVRVGSGSDWTHVSGGGDHTCGLRAEGELYCWGDDGNGQLGDGSAGGARAEPVRVGDALWRAVSAGRFHTCAIRHDDDSLWCWGAHWAGQLGIGSGEPDTVPSPRPLEAPAQWQRVSAGQSHTCAIAKEGSLWCWGEADNGRLGFGASGNEHTPRIHDVRERWLSVAAGGAHTCAVADDGGRWCWGRNLAHELGLGGDETADVREPAQGLGLGWAEVIAGDDATCGILSDGAFRCWGRNFAGLLGIGGGGDPPVPQRVCFDAERDGS